MKIDIALKSIRADFDNGVIDEAEFAKRVNATLGTIAAQATDAEKIAAFNKLADFFKTNYQIVDIDGGMQGIDSDLDHYLFEEAMKAVVGDKVFDFYNKTYEGG